MPWLLIASPYDQSISSVRSLYFSDIGFVTSPTDTPANTYFKKRLETPLAVKLSIFADGNASGRSEISVGEITLANNDGSLDELAEFDWDGRALEVRFTPESSPILSDFVTVFNGTCEQLVLGDTITIEVRDLQVLFDEPYQPVRFLGTGGIEGPAEFKDRRKPRLLGVKRQFSPVLIDQASWTFCYHDGSVGGPLEVRDGGAIITFFADYSTYSALTSASIPAGSYGTCNALGLVRLGVAPTGVFTIDAEGAKPSGTVLKKFGDIATYVVDTATSFSLSDFDSTSLSNINTICPQTLGHWYDGGSELTVRNVLDALAESPGIYYGFNDNRKIVFGRLDEPDSTPSFVFKERDLFNLTPRQSERRLKKQIVRYGQRTRPLEDQEIVGTVIGAARTALIEEWRQESASSTLVATASILSREETLDSSFDVSSDALSEAQRRLALYGPKRRSFEIEVPFIAGVLPGQTVQIFDQRYGLSSGGLFRVMSVNRQAAENILTIELWG